MQKTISDESLIDYELINEYLSKPQLPNSLIVNKVIDKLWNKTVSKVELYPRVEKRFRVLLSGKVIPKLPSIFNSIPGYREGKNEAYKEFWRLVDKWGQDLEERSYVGLPANQLSEILSHVETIDSCERDKEMFSWQQRYCDTFGLSSKVSLCQKDIFVFMQEEHKNWNVIDLDLMCFISEGFITKVTDTLALLDGTGIKCLNLASCIGRKITKAQYNSLMPGRLEEELKKRGMEVVDANRSYYKDRVVPIACEHLVIKKG